MEFINVILYLILYLNTTYLVIQMTCRIGLSQWSLKLIILHINIISFSEFDHFSISAIFLIYVKCALT